MIEEIYSCARAIVVYGNTVIHVAGDEEGMVNTTEEAIKHLITQGQEIIDILHKEYEAIKE